jgi:hypothetical protein
MPESERDALPAPVTDIFPMLPKGFPSILPMN